MEDKSVSSCSLQPSYNRLSVRYVDMHLFHFSSKGLLPIFRPLSSPFLLASNTENGSIIMKTIIGNPCVHVGAFLSPDELFFIGYVLTITDRKSPLSQLFSLMYRSLLSQFIKFNLRLLLLRQIPPPCCCYSFGTSKVGSCISNIDPGSFHFLKVSL